MSKCLTCKFALYDGMCLAHGKYTTLDSPSCAEYLPEDWEIISRLKAENEKLRELANLEYVMGEHTTTCHVTSCDECAVSEECARSVQLRSELGLDDSEVRQKVYERTYS